MKIQDLYEELKEKPFFQKFQSDNPESFLYAGFFVLDLEQDCEKIQLDIYNKKENRIEIVEFPFETIKVQENMLPGMEEKPIVPEEMKELNLDLKVDIDDLKERSKEIINANEASTRPTKIIAVIKDNEWNLTCMDNALGVVNMKINAKTGEEISFKKSSLMDIVKIKKP